MKLGAGYVEAFIFGETGKPLVRIKDHLAGK